MKSNRIFAILLTAALLLSLCACGGQPTPTVPATEPPAEAPSDPPTEASTDPPTEVPTAAPTEPPRTAMNTADLAEFVRRSTVTVNVDCEDGSSSIGTGFFIDDMGTLVTCYHVIDGANDISVQITGGGSYDVAEIVDLSVLYDLAVLKIDMEGNNYLDICEEACRTGESVYAVGSSLGFLDGTFSNGMVSTGSRKVGMIDCIQTTAAISSGNSGGPLVNEFGEVVGVNAFSYTSGENLNLAISVGMLDSLAMDKNWNINQFREWYTKEINRSYTIWNRTTGEWELAMVNTYQHVTGRACEVSDYDWAFTDGDYESMVEGYHDYYGVYGYEYHEDEFDKYTEYLNSIGFTFLESKSFTTGTSYYYENEFNGLLVDMFIMDGEEYVFVEVYTY